jgi:hypothetical protein
MAKTTKATAKRAKAKRTGKRITLIATDEKAADFRKRMKVPRGKKLVEVELFVRTPDSAAQRRLDVGATLCSCRRICVMFV